MSRRRQEAAEQAARAAELSASEAGRVLRAQREEPEVEKAPEGGERPAPRNEPRRLAMEEIERRDLEQRGLAEQREAPKEVKDPEPPTPEQMLEGGKFSQSDPEQPQPEPVAEVVEPAVETVRVKVDGEEMDVPKSEVDEYGSVKAYQIAKASEKRLREAKELTAENKRRQEALEQVLRQHLSPQEQPKSPAQVIQEKIDIVRYGSPEESAAALQEILGQNKVDPNAIIQSAVMRMQEQIAFQQFRSDFPDIVGNPMLEKFATMLGNEKAQQSFREGRVPDWSSFYKDLGNEVMGMLGKPNQQAKPAKTADPTSQVTSAREERKASIVTLPTAAARAELPKEPKPETREDVLNQMRKSRGIQTG